MMLCSSVSAILFLSTPSARRATAAKGQGNIQVQISIHALREEGDGTRRPMVPKPSNFYPRPPRGGRPKATEAAEAKEYFYPRPPRGGRRTTPRYSNITKNFYPRPPRGGRPSPADAKGAGKIFLSTPSARRATPQVTAPAGGWAISIHALREEGDRHTPNSEHGLDDFYPRPPRGGRRASPVAFLSLLTFLSTPSARRATSGRIPL